MKNLISILLVCFLVIALPGAGTLQAGVTDDETNYIDIGHQADVDAVVSVDVAVADLQAEVFEQVCSNTTAFCTPAETVVVESAMIDLAAYNKTYNGKFKPWQLIKRKAALLKRPLMALARSPRDGLRQGLNV